MLVLSRKRDETLVFEVTPEAMKKHPKGFRFQIVCVDIRGDKVRLGSDAPYEVIVHRGEVQEKIDKEVAEGRRPTNRKREVHEQQSDA